MMAGLTASTKAVAEHESKRSFEHCFISLLKTGLLVESDLVRADVAPAGSPVVWFEIYVSHLAAAEEFYGKLLNWQFSPTPG